MQALHFMEKGGIMVCIARVDSFNSDTVLASWDKDDVRIHGDLCGALAGTRKLHAPLAPPMLTILQAAMDEMRGKEASGRRNPKRRGAVLPELVSKDRSMNLTHSACSCTPS
jgi:hypothetical protein